MQLKHSVCSQRIIQVLQLHSYHQYVPLNKETLFIEVIFRFQNIMNLVKMINTTWSIIEPLLAESKPACRITNLYLAPNHFGSL